GRPGRGADHPAGRLHSFTAAGARRWRGAPASTRDHRRGGLRRSRRAHELRLGPARALSALGDLRGQDPQGGQARRPAGRAADAFRVRHQPEERQGGRGHHPAVAVVARRQGHPVNQAEKAKRFRALHERCFVIANAWDAGSARTLAGLGFPALATSSGAHAGTLGRRDGHVTRDEALAHAKAIVEATELPVSADFENCFADEAAKAAETIRLAAGVGLAGCSIEDATRTQLYGFDQSVERVAAAAKVARSLRSGFVLTARTENFLRGKPDLDDTIKRLQAFENAGADVLMAPG